MNCRSNIGGDETSIFLQDAPRRVKALCWTFPFVVFAIDMPRADLSKDPIWNTGSIDTRWGSVLFDNIARKCGERMGLGRTKAEVS